MPDLFIIMLFGFPAVFVSLLLSALGVWKEKYWLVLLGAVLFIPFSYYLSGAPGSYRLPLFLPLFQAFSAVAVREKQKRWAWLLLLPAGLAALYIVLVALVYQSQ
jgi:hypothetical protein